MDGSSAGVFATPLLVDLPDLPKEILMTDVDSHVKDLLLKALTRRGIERLVRRIDLTRSHALL